jgi:hypothetical protein
MRCPAAQSNEDSELNKPYEFRGHTYRSLADTDAWTRQYDEPALEPELAIIDPHHHVWDDQRGRYLAHELAADVGQKLLGGGESGAVSRHRGARLPACRVTQPRRDPRGAR